jgi:spermidine synthase
MEEDRKNFKIVTANNSIHVVYRDGIVELRGHDKALQSAVRLDSPERLEMVNLEYLMSVLLFAPAPRRILMLGTAAGSLLHFLLHHYPQAELTAVDIDAELIEKLLQLNILPPASDRLVYLYDDAANFIERSGRQFDLVLVDIFHGAQSPAWLLRKSSIERLYERTAAPGALAFNLLIDSEHDFRNFYRGLRQRFDGNALSLPVAGLENRIAYALRDPPPARDMTANMQQALALSAKLGIDLMPMLSVIYNTNPVGQGLI